MGHAASVSTETSVGNQIRFLRFPAVRARTGLSRSTIWRLEQEGAFPRHRRISRNAVAWVEDEITAWMLARIESTSTPTRPR
jgi:prophage regulatory protein